MPNFFIGLFHRAILQSGSGVSPKFLIPQDVAKERAYKLARAVGCSNRIEEDLLKCLQDVPVRVLEETTNRFYVSFTFCTEQLVSFSFSVYVP